VILFYALDCFKCVIAVISLSTQGNNNIVAMFVTRRRYFVILLSFSAVSGFLVTPKTLQRLSLQKGSVLSANDEPEDDGLSLDAFQNERNRRQPIEEEEDDEVFDGYALRDVIFEKWGECFDAEFQRVEAAGFKQIYLNIMPFRLGSRNFRHVSEMDYLCHLQAVVDILEKYNQIGYILYQIDATNKKPRAGTSPLVAVPLRLDLTPEEVNKIMGP
jgi:hypothetical protein